MPDLLLELFSEEIPARMQAQAAADLQRLVTGVLRERGLTYEGAAAFATPRRLALHVAGLPTRQPDTREEKKGPRVGAPEAAVQGFLRSAGLASLDQAKIEKDPKKGEFYVATIERPGQETIDVLADVLPSVIKSFPWPKSMRWGAASRRPDTLRWVRPLQSILATFGPETETPDIVRFAVDGIESGNRTWGHRFMAPEPISVRRFKDYAPALERAKVVLDGTRRRDIILHDARNLALAQGLELVEDAGLLEEVAGLVEWPVVLMGSFDASYLAIPPEVIRATIRVNQKCFVLRRPSPRVRGEGGPAPAGTDEGPGVFAAASPHPQPLTPTLSPQAGRGSLAPRFILVANIEASDHGQTVVAGNERVIAARLADAKFFYETDLKIPLQGRLPKLEKIVFHAKLGTQGERVKRIAALARELAPLAGADPDKAERAAKLAKADLVTEMVGEFPELQGLMGRYYAAAQGEDASVAAAIEEHYKPQGPNDRVPSDPVSIAVALADKIDTLVGFWAIDEKPTGSKDSYALRRAALGVTRLVLENGIRAHLASVFENAFKSALRNESKKIRNALDEIENHLEVNSKLIQAGVFQRSMDARYAWALLGVAGQYIYANCQSMSEVDTIQRDVLVDRFIEELQLIHDFCEGSTGTSYTDGNQFVSERVLAIASDLLAFFIDRLKVYLRDRGARYDLIDAALGAVPSSDPATRGHLLPQAGEGSPPMQDDLFIITRKVEALAKFLDMDDGKNLLAGFRRAANILKIEERKDGAGAYDKPHAPNLRNEAPEHKLAAAVKRAREEATERLAEEDFEGAMHALSKLRAPVDAFFDHVTVNVENTDLRLNRLRLLAELRGAMLSVADFSKIAGE